MAYFGWAPYKPVAQRRADASKFAKKRAAKGETLHPIRIVTRAMATTFWGKAWCDNLENYRDFSNRLPRGRTYARNGSIVDLQIKAGQITAIVAGSEIYEIEIEIAKLKASQWTSIRTDCASSIHSLIDLMRGRFSDAIMSRLTKPRTGLFPAPNEIKLSCDCPDSSSFCKHLAAVMYGVGNRLDNSPELLFLMRGIDQAELVTEALSNKNIDSAFTSSQPTSLENADLGAIFGIEIATSYSLDVNAVTPKPKPSRPRRALPPKPDVAPAPVPKLRRKSAVAIKTPPATRPKVTAKKVAKKVSASYTNDPLATKTKALSKKKPAKKSAK